MGENTEQTTNRKTETTAQMNELNKALLELKKLPESRLRYPVQRLNRSNLL